jgi:hypothetical protein
MKNIKSVIIMVFLLTLPFLSFSQPDPRYNGNGSSVGNTPVGNNPTGSPIDGGMSTLLILGFGYAARKLYLIRNQGKVE